MAVDFFSFTLSFFLLRVFTSLYHKVSLRVLTKGVTEGVGCLHSMSPLDRMMVYREKTAVAPAKLKPSANGGEKR